VHISPLLMAMQAAKLATAPEGEPNVEHDARLDDARAALLVDGLEPVTVIEPVQHDRCVRALPG
jgi:hypothetical protein